MASKFRAATLAIALATLGVGVVAPAAIASTPITFQVSLGSQCVFGTAPAEERVHLSLRTAGGLLRGRASATAEGGTYTICFDLVGSGINAGDTLRARVDDLNRDVPGAGRHADRRPCQPTWSRGVRRSGPRSRCSWSTSLRSTSTSVGVKLGSDRSLLDRPLQAPSTSREAGCRGRRPDRPRPRTRGRVRTLDHHQRGQRDSPRLHARDRQRRRRAVGQRPATCEPP